MIRHCLRNLAAVAGLLSALAFAPPASAALPNMGAAKVGESLAAATMVQEAAWRHHRHRHFHHRRHHRHRHAGLAVRFVYVGGSPYYDCDPYGYGYCDNAYPYPYPYGYSYPSVFAPTFVYGGGFHRPFHHMGGFGHRWRGGGFGQAWQSGGTGRVWHGGGLARTGGGHFYHRVPYYPLVRGARQGY